MHYDAFQYTPLRMTEPELATSDVKEDQIKNSRIDDPTVAEENSFLEQLVNIFHDHTYCINPSLTSESRKTTVHGLLQNLFKATSGSNSSLLEPKDEPMDGSMPVETDVNSRIDDPPVEEENSFNQQPINICHDHTYCINPSKSVRKIGQVKQSATEIKCPECEYHTRNALSWIKHLTKEHSTTPVLEGFALLCECGVVSQSSTHSRSCEIANFTVVSKSPIIPAKKTTPKCILCDTYPTTVNGYTEHLRKNHGTTMKANGIFIICACGDEFRSDCYMRFHRQKCTGTQFKIYKQLSEGSQSSIIGPNEESVETSNRSEDSLVDQHLFRTDNESFTDDKVFKEEHEEMIQAPKQFSLDFPHHDDNLVSKSNEDSDTDSSGHLNEKTGHESVMKRACIMYSPIRGVSPSIPVQKYRKQKHNDTLIGCPECEFCTRSASSWVEHLRTKHYTNPTLAGFALLCECGNESFSDSHWRICDFSNVTVIRKREGRIKRMFDEKLTPQCVLCEKHPATGHGYLDHLLRHHKSTLLANGIYLTCACGFKITCDSRPLRDHNQTCRGHGFTIHKRDEK